jgi:hypothetical protein
MGEHIETIDRDGLVIVRFVAERRDRANDVIVFRKHPERFDFETSRATIFDLQKDRCGELCSKRWFCRCPLCRAR